VHRVAHSLFILGLIGCAKSKPPAAFSFERDAGVLFRKNGHTCLEMRDSALANGTIQFVGAAMPQAVGTARVGTPAAACDAIFSDTTGSTRYDATILTGSLDEGMPALAVAGLPRPLVVSDGVLNTDIDGDGRPDAFRFCTSTDGVHLTLWNGTPSGGRREWHRYVYLGYDLDPTCTEAETKPDER
jgi:hypothetical protein